MKSKILKLISQNQTMTALKTIEDSEISDSRIKKECALLQGRFERLQSQIRKGTISEENQNLEQNKINSAIIDLLDSNKRNLIFPQRSKILIIIPSLLLLLFMLVWKINISKHQNNNLIPNKDSIQVLEVDGNNEDESQIQKPNFESNINTHLIDTIQNSDNQFLLSEKNILSKEIDSLLGKDLKKIMYKIHEWDTEETSFFDMNKTDALLHYKEIKEKTNKDFNVIHENKIADEYPHWSFTISNKTSRPQIVNKFEIFIINAMFWSGMPESKVIESIEEWNVIIPRNVGRFNYKPNKPVLISSNDAISIDLRFGCTEESGKLIDEKYEVKSIFPASERGPFVLAVIFKSDEDLYAMSKFILLDEFLLERISEY